MMDLTQQLTKFYELLEKLFKTTMRENERMSALQKESVAKQSLHCNWTKVKIALMVPFSKFCVIRILN